jgi:hypothetical protein
MTDMLDHGSTSYADTGTEIALTLAHAASLTIDEWLEQGRELATQHRNHEWLIGDWCKTGQDLFGDEIKPYLPSLGLEPSQVRRAAKVAATFPAHERDAGLSFAHYASLVDLPHGEARKILAHAKGKPAKMIRVEAMGVKEQLGIAGLPSDDDPVRREFLQMQWAWNRGSQAARKHFLQLAMEAELAVIDG